MAMKIGVGVLALAMTGLAFAADKTDKSLERLEKREAHQQQRITNDINTNKITAADAVKLQKRQDKLVADTQAAKADGKVTPEEKAALRREANSNASAISRKEHPHKKHH
jgi:tellurite resistance protein